MDFCLKAYKKTACLAHVAIAMCLPTTFYM